MNILYISFLNGDSWAGPTYSVPKQITAQKTYDNVFWYNIRKSDVKEWKSNLLFHDLDDYPEGKICSLPEPFCNPDLIVVEQFYGYAGQKIFFELMRGNYNYIIIPRGELTVNAQLRKPLKKKLGNLLLFNSFAKNANAIQYLTEQEKIDSGDRWNKKTLVISNGIDIPAESNKTEINDRIKLVFIGRLSPWQKGLDLLVEAFGYVKDLLLDCCTVEIYGPDYDNKRCELEKNIAEMGLEKVVHFNDGVFGEEKKAILTSSDVFLITSRFEGHPIALIEALSYGLPCIATTGSNMRNEVEKYNAGWCADNEALSIADAIERMINEKQYISAKGYNAKSLAKEYDWQRIAQKSHEEYVEIIKGRN